MQVSLPVVRRFVKSVGEKAIGMGVVRGVRPDQQLVKVCSHEKKFFSHLALKTFSSLYNTWKILVLHVLHNKSTILSILVSVWIFDNVLRN